MSNIYVGKNSILSILGDDGLKWIFLVIMWRGFHTLLIFVSQGVYQKHPFTIVNELFDHRGSHPNYSSPKTKTNTVIAAPS